MQTNFKVGQILTIFDHLLLMHKRSQRNLQNTYALFLTANQLNLDKYIHIYTVFHNSVGQSEMHVVVFVIFQSIELQKMDINSKKIYSFNIISAN